MEIESDEMNVSRSFSLAELSTAAEARVVLFDSDRTSARRIRKILQATVEQVDVCRDLEQVKESLSRPPDVLIVNYDQLDWSEQSELFSCAKTRCQLLGYGSQLGRHDLATLLEQHGVTNLLTIDQAGMSEELLVTLRKILSEDIIGIDKYFPWGARHNKLTLQRSADIPLVVQKAESFLESIGVSRRLVYGFSLVTEELISNALYNAPVDARGRRLFSNLPRTEEVQLPEDASVAVDFCCEGRRAGVAVRDPYGSLTVELVLEYLARCFRKAGEQISEEPGGAGLGLFQAFEALSHFIVNLVPGQCTEIIGLIDIRGSYSDFLKGGKSFNVFVQHAPF